MSFLRRLLIVTLAAFAIVGAAWVLKHVDGVNAYFHEDEFRGSVEEMHESSHERWPALQFGDAANTLVMLPIVASVISIDRRRRRKSTRIPSRPASHSVTVNSN